MPHSSRFHSIFRATALALGMAIGLAGAAIGNLTGSTGQASPTAIDNTQPTLALDWIICVGFDGANYPALIEFYPNVGNGPYYSEIRAVARNPNFQLPPGWMYCHGQSLQINQYAGLFALLGFTFGGNGSTIFSLPDLRGRVPVGVGTGTSLSEVTLGQKIGSESHILSTANLPAHIHSISGGNTDSSGAGQALKNAQPGLGLYMTVATGGTTTFSAAGWIRFWAGNYPQGLNCDGATYNSNANGMLATRLGPTFGGNWPSSFKVPDLRGRTPVGTTGTIGAVTPRELGDSFGTESIALTAAQMPAHTHSYLSGTTGSAGSTEAHNTVQPSLGLDAYICVYGDFFSFADFGGNDSATLGEVRFHAATTGFGTDNVFWKPCKGATYPVAGDGIEYYSFAESQDGYFGSVAETVIGTPDLRGRALAGRGTGANPTLTTRAFADTWGTEWASVSAANLPAHAHSVTALAPPNSPPVIARNNASVSVNEGSTASNAGTFSDVNGNPTVTLSASIGSVIGNAGPGTWSWSFNTADGPDQSQTVTITATDNAGGSASTTFSLSVVNVAPIATEQVSVNAVTLNEDAPPTTITLASFDPGADTRVYSIVFPPPANEGTLGAVSGNTVQFIPAPDFNGVTSFTFKATDSDAADSGPATVQINVLPINDAPVGGADSLTRVNNTKVAKILRTSLLGNDSDAESDPLSITAVGNALPAGSTVVIAGAFVIYTAPAVNSGNGSFTYTLSDGPGGHSVVVTVPVTQVPPASAATPPNATSIVTSGADRIATFLGVPGFSYRIQFSTSPGPVYTWNEFNPLATFVAPANGVITFTDVGGAGSGRTYRMIPHP